MAPNIGSVDVIEKQPLITCIVIQVIQGILLEMGL
jgi:hypothetical protein